MRMFAGLAVTITLGFALSACTDSDVGKACDKAADCGEHLICDVHDGKGTCQEPHDHEAGEAESAAEATTGTTDAIGTTAGTPTTTM